MKIFPAIDLIDGQAVRLVKGDYAKSKVYEKDVVSVAKRFCDDGAKYLHIVDLNGAKDGNTRNFSIIEKIVASTGMFCEVGGGIRSMESIEAYLNCGVGRVILGTAAINNPSLLKGAVEKFDEKICVGVDTKNGAIAVNGWLEVTDVDGVDFCKQLKNVGVKSVIYTDISKDGMLEGTNLPLYRKLSEIDDLEITASGGISSIKELIALKEMGISSAILGKALYEGVIDLKTAIQTVEI